MSRRQKNTLIRIISAAVLLVAAYLAPVEGYWRLAAFLVPYLVIGWDVLWKAVRNIFHGHVFDENLLMSIATVGALCLKEYGEAVFVMLFYQVGELFQSYAVGRSRRSIAALMDIRPDYANIERDGELVQIDPEDAAVGDVIVVKPGERIPLDGVVVEGVSSLNTMALTGEALPRDVEEGDGVISGCVNINGLIKVRVTREFGESTVSKILELVENSASNKARTENFITRFARWYTPIVVICAACLAVFPPLLSLGTWGEWVSRALIFLVISCPCALVISVPLSFFGGIGGASKCGILIKGSNYMEALSKSEIVVFDKTGTLTEGIFKVTAVHPSVVSEDELLKIAATAESYSDHPISVSLRSAYGKAIDKSSVGDVEEIAGQGIRAVIDGRIAHVGNSKLMESVGVEYRNCHRHGTIVHIAVEGEYAGHIVISDEIKGGSPDAIRSLKSHGIRRTVMLTGDREAVAADVAKRLDIDEYHAELLPDDKVSRVESLIGETSPKGSLVFVGDGINDAPVLSRADVGAAMGAFGSDAAIEAADIVLMDDDPSKIPLAIDISKRTLRIVMQNIVFALGIKLLFLALGAFGLANMWEAVFADVGVSVIAILNAMRALKAPGRASRS